MKNILLCSLNENAPLRQKRKKGKSTQWLTSEIKTQMSIRDHLLRTVNIESRKMLMINKPTNRNAIKLML